MNRAKADIERLADLAGITINGPATTDIQITDERAYRTLLSGDNIAIGEAFMDGWWDVADLASFYTQLLEANITDQVGFFNNPGTVIRAIFFNLQSRARAFQVAKEHYDLGNDLYESMLDDRMVYTCARFEQPDMTLEVAQEAKLDWFCRQLDLKPGQRILDIGCGWGSFMQYAAARYGVSCVGLSVSREQTNLGRKRCAGWPIEFVIQDYREYYDTAGFDHIVSIEMIEAVGTKNFRKYFETAHRLLRPGGRFGLQTIGSCERRPKAEPWIDKYIFPNGVLPALHQLDDASRGLFILEQLENIGPNYDPTLMEWWHRFDKNYEALANRNSKYDARFYRMWKYYLQGCAGAFRTRNLHDWQMIFSRE